LVLIAASLLTAFGCGGRPKTDRRELARIGERAITVADFAAAYRRAAAQDTTIHPGFAGRKQVIENLVQKNLMEIVARERYPELIDRQKARLDAFHDDETRRTLREREINRKIRITEDEIKALWESRDTRYKVRRIALTTLRDAEEAMAMLKQGAAFPAVASSRSKDPESAYQGGEMEWIVPGSVLGPDFEAAMMSLEPGQTSGIVETTAGFEIIRLETKEPSTERRPLEEERRMLELTLMAREAERLRGQLREQLFKSQKVRLPENGQALVASWLPAAVSAGAVGPLSEEDSLRVLVAMKGGDITGADYARALRERPVDLWPDPSDPGRVNRSLRDMAYDVACLREAVARKIDREPEIAGRLADRENRTRVVRFHYLDVETQVHPTPEDYRRVYEEGRDRYVFPVRHVVHRAVVVDSAAALGFASTVRSGTPFGKAADAVRSSGAAIFTADTSAPDTVIASMNKEIEEMLLSLTAPGQVAGPRREPDGTFMVIRLESILPARPMTYEEALVYVERDAPLLEGERILKAILDEARERHPVRIDEELLKEIEDPAPKPEGEDS
jgi:parvulin-like peptidyl-prolyl isomerase